MTRRPLVNRTTLTLLVALAGVILAARTTRVMADFGPAVYFLSIGLVVLGLAALARPRPR